MRKIIPILILIATLQTTCYAFTFKEYINTVQSTETSQSIRHSWTIQLGFDIFRPYYVAESWKDKIKNKFSIHICGLHGTMDFDLLRDHFIEYKFMRRF